MNQPAVQYVVDRALVEEEIARTRARLAQGGGRWFLRSFARTAAVMYAIALVAQWGRADQLAALPAEKRIAFLLFPAVAALAIAWLGRRQMSAALDTDQRVRDIAAELRSLGGSGWAVRSLRSGMLLGAAVGVPVGILLALSWEPQQFPVSNRWMVVPSFVGVTMLWTIPFAFVLRWVSLLALRRFVKPLSGPAS